MISISSGFLYLYVFCQSAGLEAVFLRLAYPHKVHCFWRKMLAVNAITHPLVVFFLLADGWMNNLPAVLVAEGFAVVAEIFLLKLALEEASWSKCFVLSLAANLFSWQLGPVLTWSMVKLVGA